MIVIQSLFKYSTYLNFSKRALNISLRTLLVCLTTFNGHNILGPRFIAIYCDLYSIMVAKSFLLLKSRERSDLSKLIYVCKHYSSIGQREQLYLKLTLKHYTMIQLLLKVCFFLVILYLSQTLFSFSESFHPTT